LGAGDIGTDAKEVEQNLEKHFTLAHKWGCVLLLDEADVFLAKRDVSIRRQHCYIRARSIRHSIF
jgi:hypothetical protein